MGHDGQPVLFDESHPAGEYGARNHIRTCPGDFRSGKVAQGSQIINALHTTYGDRQQFSQSGGRLQPTCATRYDKVAAVFDPGAERCGLPIGQT